MSKVEALLSKAVDRDSIRPNSSNPNYTSPRTWGVYEIVGTDSGAAGKRYRKGNHPIRHRELLREFGVVKLLALFTEESLAIDLASSLNS
jgi:hypothetical protein